MSVAFASALSTPKMLRSLSDWIINRLSATNFGPRLVKPLDLLSEVRSESESIGNDSEKQPRQAGRLGGTTHALRPPKSLGADPTGQSGRGRSPGGMKGDGRGAREVSRRTFARTEKDKDEQRFQEG